MRLGVGVAVLLICPTVVPADEKAEKAEEEKARLACMKLLDVCLNYQNNPANQKHLIPMRLLDLVEPPFGGTGYLPNGEKDLLDPWGKMLLYAVAINEKGQPQPYIWAERKVDGKTKVIGTKPPEPKKK